VVDLHSVSRSTVNTIVTPEEFPSRKIHNYRDSVRDHQPGEVRQVPPLLGPGGAAPQRDGPPFPLWCGNPMSTLPVRPIQPAQRLLGQEIRKMWQRPVSSLYKL